MFVAASSAVAKRGLSSSNVEDTRGAGHGIIFDIASPCVERGNKSPVLSVAPGRVRTPARGVEDERALAVAGPEQHEGLVRVGEGQTGDVRVHGHARREGEELLTVVSREVRHGADRALL